MPSIRLELHVDAFNQYRNDASVVDAMEALAHGIHDRAAGEVTFHNDDTKEPFRVVTQHNSSRAVTFVSTNSIDGELAEAINRTLTRAIP